MSRNEPADPWFLSKPSPRCRTPQKFQRRLAYASGVDKASDQAKHPCAAQGRQSLPAAQIGLLKYPGQPHVPSGNGRKSGEFGSGQEGGLAPTPAFLEVPIPFELPLEPVIPFGVRPGPPVTLPPTAPVPSPDRLPNPDEAEPNRNQLPKTRPDGDEPKVCPAPVPDVRRGRNAAADQFEIDMHNTVNADNPLKLGEAIFYHGVYFDDCARKDDPLGRWKAGDMIEAKGPTYDKLINSDFSWVSASWGLLDQAERQNMAVEGTGRRDVYLVAELGAVEDMKKLFVDFDNIDVFHVAPVTPVPKPGLEKSGFFREIWCGFKQPLLGRCDAPTPTGIFIHGGWEAYEAS